MEVGPKTVAKIRDKTLASADAKELVPLLLNKTMSLPPGMDIASVQALAAVPQATPSGEGAVPAPATAVIPSGEGSVPVPATAVPMVGPKTLEKYLTPGVMLRGDRIELEKSVRAGLVGWPEGVPLDDTKPLTTWESIKEAFSGEDRTTPEIKNKPDWMSIPELRENSWEGLKSTIGTLMSSPDETVKVIKENHPDVGLRKDTKGNWIMTSAIDGKDYPIAPGFHKSDGAQAIVLAASFIPASKAVTVPGAFLAHGATQAVIEGTQAATGGDFDVREVQNAATLGAAFTGAGGLIRGSPKELSPVGGTVTDVTQTMRTAAKGGMGSKKATQALAVQTKLDQEALDAAKRLEIVEYLQPDHVSTNQVYREVAQAVKSIPGSEARAAELEGFERIAKRADDLVEELGGTKDFSTLDYNVKDRMIAIQTDLESTAKTLYQKLDDTIPPTERNPAENIIAWLKTQLKNVGGKKSDLDPLERELLSRMYSTPIKKDGKIIGYKHPTYALLERTRKQLTAARVKSQGQDVFKNADKKLIGDLERELLKDQRVVAAKFGLEGVFDTAQLTVAMRKGLESDLKSLFGKELQKSLIGDLTQSFKKLSAGDVSKFTKLMTSIPKEMRQEVTASGLLTAFGVTAKQGQLSFTNYAKWFQGLLKNKKAYTVLMDNLPKAAKKRLSDLYRISYSLSRATKERITTGRSNIIQNQLSGAEGLVSKIYGATKKVVKGAAAEAILAPTPLKGAGVMWGLLSGLSKNKPDLVKAADELLLSYAFRNAVTEFGTAGERKAITHLAKSKMFKTFAQKVNLPKSLSSYEQWILASLQSGRQLKGEE